jgi:xylose isomerase
MEAPLPSDPDALVKKLDNFGLKVSNIAVECWSDRKWKHGSFATNDANIRKEVVKLFKESIDFAKAVNADSVLLWPAHDGFDYPFQVNYADGWKNMVETVREIAEYDPGVKIALEAKSKDPRQKQYISNTGKAMALINDVGLDNVGGALDVGHSLMAQENLAESLMLLDSHKKLVQIHLNENYKDSDPDMIFGTINFWEILEFFYYLNKTDFEGWSSVDIISGRDDREKSLSLSIKLVWKFKELADKLSKHSDEIDSNLKGYKFADNMNLITDMILQ